MKTKRVLVRFVALVTALVMIVPGLMVLPVSAIDIEDTTYRDFLWELDFDNMLNLVDNMGNTEYTLDTAGSANVKMVTFDGRRALGIENSRGHYYIIDNNNILDDYETFFIEADMYFESYPASDGGTDDPNSYPMSFMTWMTKNDNKNATTAYRSIRVDADGYLCTSTSAESRTEARLPLGEWFNIRFIVSPRSGLCEVLVNDQRVLTYKVGAPKNMAESIIRFFDTRYKYSVYFSDISVYSDNTYRIGLTEEVSADYVAYQTTKPRDGKFDVRVLAGLDDLRYYNVGFVVTTLWEENGTVKTREEDLSEKTVYETVIADGKNVAATDLGYNYLATLPIRGINADGKHTEIIVRPYVDRGDVRVFGNAIILLYAGDSADGYPVLTAMTRSMEYTATPSDDTYIRPTTNTNFGQNEVLELKNNGAGQYTRKVFLQFSFSEAAIKKVYASSRIYLEFHIDSARAATEDEANSGGILAEISGVKTGWREDELTGINYEKLASEIKWVADVRYQANQFVKVDVTDYVMNNIDDNGQVAFCIGNVENDGSSGQAKIGSTESGNGPRLLIYPILYNHEVNLAKFQNEGYDPWGYAETIVDQWFDSERKTVWEDKTTYETIDLTAVDNSAPTGDYTIESEWKHSSPSAAWSAKKYARSINTLTGFTASAKSQFDQYGGVTNSGIKGSATGYFHTEAINGRTYIIDPLGNPFFAIGINTVQLGSTENQKKASVDKYGSEAKFYSDVTDEMRSIGINTYWGGDEAVFKEEKLATAVSLGCVGGYMTYLGLSVSTGGSAEFMYNNTMNVFDPDFVSYLDSKVAPVVAAYGDSPYILGFYSDNEIPSQSDMLYCYLTVDAAEPVNAFSYATAWTWFMRATGKNNPSTADITPALSEEFKAFVYNQYFKVITEAIDRAGGGAYMYLGNRIHGENYTSEGYLRAAAQYVDILTVNLYGGLEPPIETIKLMYKYTGKPFIVTEFFAKADDALDMNGYSMGNQTNAGWIVHTQEDRAIHYENYALLLLESQTCVGWTWYRFRDNDQTIYKDPAGNLYRAYDYTNKKISAYCNVNTEEVIPAGNIENSLTVFYQGERDTTNLGSNKGIYDNHMNLYSELAGAITKISDNLFALINYFDGIHK